MVYLPDNTNVSNGHVRTGPERALSFVCVTSDLTKVALESSRSKRATVASVSLALVEIHKHVQGGKDTLLSHECVQGHIKAQKRLCPSARYMPT